MPPRPHQNATPPNLIIVRRKKPTNRKEKENIIKAQSEYLFIVTNFVTYNIVY